MAETNHKAAQQAVEDYRRSLEKRYGVPITVRSDVTMPDSLGRVTPAWCKQPPANYHSIELASSLPELAKPHALAHELTHLDLIGQTKDLGKLKIQQISGSRYGASIKCLKRSSRKTCRHGVKGHTEDLLWQMNCEILTRINDQLLNVAVDMVVETKIKQRMPLLAPSQVVCARIAMDELLDAKEWVLLQRKIRRRFYRAIRALDGAYALFLDALFDNTTNYFAQHRDTQYAKLARSLVRRFHAMFPKLQPGGEYDIVDSFAELLGLRDSYTWIAVPLPPLRKTRHEHKIALAAEVGVS